MRLSQMKSKQDSFLIADWVGDNTERYHLLTKSFFADEYRESQRAAMVLGHVHDRQPHLIKPYLPQMIEHLRRADIHDAGKRNIVRTLQTVDLPEDLWGKAADICFTFVADPGTAVAIRVFSMTVLWNLCQKIPELMPELRATIEDWLDYGTAGFKSRGKKILKQISAYEQKYGHFGHP